MSRNLDYDDTIEILPAGYSSNKYVVEFTINYDITKYVAATHNDPAYGPEVSVNSVQLRCNKEKVECPRWLEIIILDAVDDEVLSDFAMDNASWGKEDGHI